MTDERLAELTQAFIAARDALVTAEAALRARIAAATAKGQLVRYGDLEEYAPYQAAQEAYNAAADAYADALLAGRKEPPA